MISSSIVPASNIRVAFPPKYAVDVDHYLKDYERLRGEKKMTVPQAFAAIFSSEYKNTFFHTQYSLWKQPSESVQSVLKQCIAAGRTAEGHWALVRAAAGQIKLPSKVPF